MLVWTRLVLSFGADAELLSSDVDEGQQADGEAEQEDRQAEADCDPGEDGEGGFQTNHPLAWLGGFVSVAELGAFDLLLFLVPQVAFTLAGEADLLVAFVLSLAHSVAARR